MASFTKHLSFFFVLVLFSSLRVEARESRFFSKVTHYTAPKVSFTEAPTPAPAPAPAPEVASTPVVAPTPSPTYSESENGYGFYGRGSSQFPPTKETPPTTTKFEDEFLTEELSRESFETGYPKTNLYSNNGNPNNYNNNNGYTTNYNSNGYVNNYNGNGYSNNYNGNGYSNSYNSNGYQSERQGMSDTRFMENGKYYVDAKNENNLNGYQGYYGNNMFPNEFNSMEEYEKQEEPVP